MSFLLVIAFLAAYGYVLDWVSREQDAMLAEIDR
jgi:hypothetical protein